MTKIDLLRKVERIGFYAFNRWAVRVGVPLEDALWAVRAVCRG